MDKRKRPAPPRSPENVAERLRARQAATNRKTGESESVIHRAIGRAVVALLSERGTVSAVDVERYFEERLASRPASRYPELDVERVVGESVIRKMRTLSGN